MGRMGHMGRMGRMGQANENQFSHCFTQPFSDVHVYSAILLVLPAIAFFQTCVCHPLTQATLGNKRFLKLSELIVQQVIRLVDDTNYNICSGFFRA